jgi:hypothetical protein
MTLIKLSKRSNNFILNKGHPLFRGLAFAGLGNRRFPKNSKFFDSSLYRNDATFTPTTMSSKWTWDNALHRYVLSFDGSTNYISREDVTIRGVNRTFAAWVYNGNNSSYNGILLQNINALADATNTALNGIWFTYDNANILSFNVGDGANYTQNSSGPSITIGKWTHIVVVIKGGSSLSCYLNGVLTGTPTATTYFPFNTAARIQIGYLGGLYLTGSIADPMIWSRALLPSEIYQLSRPKNVMLSGLILPPKHLSIPKTITTTTTTTVSSHHRRRRLICSGGIM